ncbi:MAG: plasmid partitioning protein RepB [Tritonibacter mobilis]|nr:plasmid partitioning protein RepB [Ruegeria sp. TrichCH4B]MCK5500295.1 plasmid partitioning protein RepB [Tritonibacter mobilis]
MARKGILTSTLTPPLSTDDTSSDKPRMMPRGAVGALQSSLTKLQESAVQDIDVSLIDNAGVEDRLGVDDIAQSQLIESIREYGQQVPVLLRPHPTAQGRYEIVYGRRRLMAMRTLGIPVKAMVRHLDDQALVMAQGQENNARQDLSFIEKASFAAQLQAAGYDRQTIAAALSVDLPMISRFLKVGTAFSIDFLRKIGSAPSIGRDRWLRLADLLKPLQDKPECLARVFMKDDFIARSSDERFEMVLAAIEAETSAVASSPSTADKTEAPVKPQKRQLARRDGKPIADLKSTPRGVTLTIPSRSADGFDSWFETHAEALLQDLHDRWKKQAAED